MTERMVIGRLMTELERSAFRGFLKGRQLLFFMNHVTKEEGALTEH